MQQVLGCVCVLHMDVELFLESVGVFVIMWKLSVSVGECCNVEVVSVCSCMCRYTRRVLQKGDFKTLGAKINLSVNSIFPELVD